MTGVDTRVPEPVEVRGSPAAGDVLTTIPLIPRDPEVRAALERFLIEQDARHSAIRRAGHPSSIDHFA